MILYWDPPWQTQDSWCKLDETRWKHPAWIPVGESQDVDSRHPKRRLFRSGFSMRPNRDLAANLLLKLLLVQENYVLRYLRWSGELLTEGQSVKTGAISGHRFSWEVPFPFVTMASVPDNIKITDISILFRPVIMMMSASNLCVICVAVDVSNRHVLVPMVPWRNGFSKLNLEPILKQTQDPAPFAAIQALLCLFWLVPLQAIVLFYTFRLTKPQLLWGLTLVQARLVGQVSSFLAWIYKL